MNERQSTGGDDYDNDDCERPSGARRLIVRRRLGPVLAGCMLCARRCA